MTDLDPNEQLREHLTEEEFGALHDILDDPTASLARPLGTAAAAGAATLATTGTAAADPSTTDSDPDVGLPGDRFDLWADGVDSNDVHAGRYHDGVNVVSLTASQSPETFTVGPGEFTGSNTTAIELDASDHDTNTFLEFPPSVPADGQVLRIYFDVTNAGDGVDLRVDESAPSIEWDGPSRIFSFGRGSATALVTARTYDGGSTWYGSFQFGDYWQEV